MLFRSLNELAELCLDYGASYYQIYEKHVHCDWRSFEKDKQFFGEQARGRTMSKITRSLEQESSITSTTQADYIEFKAHHPLSEDGEGLRYQWKIKFPDGKLLEAQDQSVVKVPSQKGVYKVGLLIGGNTELTYQITIK